MRIAVVNTGASTIKLAVLETDADGLRELTRLQRDWSGQDPAATMQEALESLTVQPDALGHRVVHGGRQFSAPTAITDDVVQALEALSELAPLHNPPAVAAIRAARQIYPDLPAVAVFDTAFHGDRPAASMRYALPAGMVEALSLRRYGFHGIAHASLVEALAAERRVAVNEICAVTLQLGAGCSACAVQRGRSIETSMGYTPLEGLVMASRCGSIDPAIVTQLVQAGHDADWIDEQLTRRSGLLALCGRTDMREILAGVERGEADAAFAVEMFCHHLVVTIGGYLTLLGGDGAIVFGGGIGTHAAQIRRRVAEGLGAWNVQLDEDRNAAGRPGRISAPGSRAVYALPTDEEAVIARAVAAVLGRS